MARQIKNVSGWKQKGKVKSTHETNLFGTIRNTLSPNHSHGTIEFPVDIKVKQNETRTDELRVKEAQALLRREQMHW